MTAPSDVTEVVTQFTAQVKSEDGKPLISTPPDETQLTAMVCDDAESALCWWARVKLRLIGLKKKLIPNS